MKKVIYLSICFSLLLNSIAFSQEKLPPHQYFLIGKNNDTCKCYAGGWRVGNLFLCNNEKIKKIKYSKILTDYKTVIKNGDNIFLIRKYHFVPNKATWNIVPIDIDKPSGKLEARLSNVPPVMYSDEHKIAVLIQFPFIPKIGGNGIPPIYEKKPACFEFIKKQIEHDLDSLKIYPIVFYNEEDYSVKSAIESGATTLITFSFWKFPSENKTKKNQAVINDFGDVYLSINDMDSPIKTVLDGVSYNVDKEALYKSRGIGNESPENYRKTWRKFLIDYQTNKPK